MEPVAADQSGWRLMIPLVAVDDAPDAPPLVVTVGSGRAVSPCWCSAPPTRRALRALL